MDVCVCVCTCFSKKDRTCVPMYIRACVFSSSYYIFLEKSEAVNKQLYYHSSFCINVSYKS